MSWSRIARAVLAVAAFAVPHSVLAALPVKRYAAARFGERRVAGAYRLVYNVVAALSAATVAHYLYWELPDRPLYRVRGWPRGLMHAGQAIALVGTGLVARRIGVLPFSGLPAFLDLIAGRPIRPTPPVQHPLPDGHDLYESWGTPYHLSSHPNNYFPLLAYWLSPVMTVKWAVVGAAVALYMILGSQHEARRLKAIYGDRFRHYQERVPHLGLPVGRDPMESEGADR